MGCPIETQINGRTFACILERGHWDRDCFFWLAEPAPGVEWTAELLLEDEPIGGD